MNIHTQHTHITPTENPSISDIFVSLSLISLLSGVLLWAVPSFAYGVSQNEIPEIQEIQRQLTNSYLDTDEKALGLRILEEKILESKIETLTIEDNIAEYDSDIAVLQEKINVLFPLLVQPKQDIAQLQSRKKDLNVQIQKQGKMMVTLYLEMTSVQTPTASSGASGVMAMLMQTPEEELNDEITIDALKEIESHTKDVYMALLDEMAEVQKEEDNIRADIADKETKYKSLSEQRDKLQQEKELQEALLMSAQENKDEYTELLSMSRKQMMQSMIDAVRVDTTLQELNEKIAELEENKLLKQRGEATLTADRIQNLELKDEYNAADMTEEVVATIDLKMLEDAKNIIPKAPLAWPVNPLKGISAYFRQASYYERFKMQHNAIDIPAPQGTDMAAAADGYVYKAVDNGLGYSYIILLHRNNLRTVYGHVSNIYVTPGQMIQEGDIIGTVGGTPGTKGAGKMTTGPHLHFEVLENEVYKDPLEFLEAGVL